MRVWLFDKLGWLLGKTKLEFYLFLIYQKLFLMNLRVNVTNKVLGEAVNNMFLYISNWKDLLSKKQWKEKLTALTQHCFFDLNIINQKQSWKTDKVSVNCTTNMAKNWYSEEVI